MEAADLALDKPVVRADYRVSATLIVVRCGARHVDLAA
jgi:hypothetical protein